MKYWEVNAPYCAVLKAETVEEAMEKYTEVVADGITLDDIEELERDYALAMSSRVLDEDGNTISILEVMEQFNSPGADVLVMEMP